MSESWYDLADAHEMGKITSMERCREIYAAFDIAWPNTEPYQKGFYLFRDRVVPFLFAKIAALERENTELRERVEDLQASHDLAYGVRTDGVIIKTIEPSPDKGLEIKCSDGAGVQTSKFSVTQKPEDLK